MGFLKSLFNMFNPNYISYGGDELFPKYFDYMWHSKRGEWSEISDKFLALDYSEQCNLLSIVGKKLSKEQNPLEKWKNNGDSPYYYHLFQAAYLIERAWHFRGGGTADTVSDDRFNNFQSLIALAEESLEEASLNSEVTGQIYALKLIVHLCLSDEFIQIDTTLGSMRELDSERALPVNLNGHVTVLNAACEKWLGSHEQMFAFARDYATKDAGHGYMASLICYAHLQRWIYMDMFDEDAEGAAVYFDQDSVKTDLANAHHWFTDNPHPTATGFNLNADNMFAGMLSLSGQHDLARPHFEAMGKRALDFPWTYIGNEKLNKFRDLHK